MTQRITPKFSLWPIVKIKWRWHRSGERTHHGARWFLFGIVPVWQVKRKVEV